jgi:hypothetical protein
VNIGLSLLLVRHIGCLGVIGGTILSYLIVLVVPQSLIVWGVFRKELAVEAVESHKPVFANRSWPGQEGVTNLSLPRRATNVIATLLTNSGRS